MGGRYGLCGGMPVSIVSIPIFPQLIAFQGANLVN